MYGRLIYTRDAAEPPSRWWWDEPPRPQRTTGDMEGVVQGHQDLSQGANETSLKGTSTSVERICKVALCPGRCIGAEFFIRLVPVD